MTRTVLMTTDERFQKVGDGEWWDITGIDIVPQEEVDQHLSVSVMVMQHQDEDPQAPDLS